jgi:hypothetical protein
MRPPRQETTSGLHLLLTTSLLSALTQRTWAHPYPKDELHDVGFSFLQDPVCHEYCGLQNEHCCQKGSACITESATPTCLDGIQVLTTTWIDVGEVVMGLVKRGQGVYTTTWTETKTFTSTVTTSFEDAPNTVGAVKECAPDLAKGQTWCGPVCCAFWQECGEYGQCITRDGCSEGFCPGGIPGVVVSDTSIMLTTTDQFGKPTTMYSAPYRVTGTGSGTTPSATFIGGDAQAGHDGGGGLSPGAIAGIVIGTLVGIGLLILLCFCCIVRGIWGALFGGKKKKKKERIDVYEEEYSRHGSRVPSSRYSRRDNHGSWYGDRPPKEKSSGKGWLGITAAAGTILALLSLRKEKKKPKKKAATVYSDSFYSYSGTGTSPSKFCPLHLTPRKVAVINDFSTGSSSSGGHTRRTGRTRTSGRSRR